ncbi:MAG: sodium:solute symporter family protein [Planctomycetota bacterium]
MIAAVLVVSLGIGVWSTRQASKSEEQFFLSGRSMPWWVLGTSMVATTFAIDTPNLVTQIVRENGVAGNWIWWALLLSTMSTTFIFARLWRRSEVLTDNEFYELRYSGRSAAFLRAFRALYLGLVFNTLVMANVNLAGIKFGAVLLGWDPWQTLFLGCGVTVVYASLGGLRGILLTDGIQFVLAMVGSIAAAVYLIDLPEIGGIDRLLRSPDVIPKLDMVPDTGNPDLFVAALVMPLLVVWWSAFYPGAEPGGGGYIAQRMLAAKSEGHALGATLLYNIAHYALRPWPWILIGLCSIVVFPTTESLQAALPGYEGEVENDLAYPLMLTKLPAGLLGLVIASLVAAYMSTISTQVNIGSSYLTHDFYKRFVDHKAEQRKLVWVGRLITVGIVVLAAFVSLALESAKDTFELMLLVGAGSGAIYLLRWLWWRVNATAEITAMVVSFLVAVATKYFGDGLEGYEKTLIVTGVTTASWLIACFVGEKTDDETLEHFATKIRPPGPGWKGLQGEGKKGDLMLRVFATVCGVLFVWGLLLTIGYVIYGEPLGYALTGTVSAVGGAGLMHLRKQL